MKLSSLFIALVTTLAFGAGVYAAGPARSHGAGASVGMGTQTHSAGVGNIGGATQTRVQIHTPGTGLADPTLRGTGAGTGAAAGMPRGIHPPGTGLTTAN